jgi:hypothetical protein
MPQPTPPVKTAVLAMTVKPTVPATAKANNSVTVKSTAKT